MRDCDPAAIRRRLVAVSRLVDGLLSDVDWRAFDRCDCGHRRLEHVQLTRGSEAGRWPCLRAGCVCVDFDDLHGRADEFERCRRERERIARGVA